MLFHANNEVFEFSGHDDNISTTYFNAYEVSSRLTNSRTMKAVVSLGCNSGEPNEGLNMATELAKKSNIEKVIASDGYVTHNKYSFIWNSYTFWSSKEAGKNHEVKENAKGFKVYTKDSNGKINTKMIGGIGKKYNIKSLLEAAK